MLRFILALIMFLAACGDLRAQELLLVLDGESAEDQFGISVAGGCDFNGDGCPDVAVGANVNDAGGLSAGRVYVYFGGPQADSIPDVILQGEERDFFGSPVCFLEDFSGDGISDLAVGASRNSEGGTDAGKVYVFFGGISPDSIADMEIVGQAPGGRFGRALSSGLDINDDGFADLVVGAPSEGSGRVYVYFGGVSPDDIADMVLNARADSESFGSAVAGLKDVNGDNFGDLAIGAEMNSEQNVWQGKTYVFFGGSPPDTLADVVIPGEAIGDFFGGSLASAGDVNGDGFGDLLAGAPYSNAGGLIDAGRTYLFFGGVGMDSIADLTISGEAADDHFGISLSSLAFFDEDSPEDYMVGGHTNDAGGLDAGKAYIFFGGQPPSSIPDTTLLGEADADEFGYALAGINGFSGSTMADLIVGAWGCDAGRGRAYIYRGPATVSVADVEPTEQCRFTLGACPCPSRGAVVLRALPSLEPFGALKDVHVEIVNVTGRMVRAFTVPAVTAIAGIPWDGRDNTGASVGSGIYVARLKLIRASDSLPSVLTAKIAIIR